MRGAENLVRVCTTPAKLLRGGESIGAAGADTGERMGATPCALRLERDAGANGARGIGRAQQGIDPYRRGNPVRRPLPEACAPQRVMSMVILAA
jgi:hypothetical protein